MWNISRMPQAREALQQADQPSETGDDISRLIEKTAELKSLLVSLRPEFEYSGPRTVGGVPAASAYAIRVPFASPCEVSILSVSSTDSSANCTLFLSTDPNQDIGASNASTLTTTLDGNQSFLFMASVYGGNSVPYVGSWLPVQSSSELYVYVLSSASNGSYFTLQFRRRVNAAGVPNPGF